MWPPRVLVHPAAPYPSTVGWAQWVAAGQAEKAFVSATRHLQRANDAIGRVDAVPAHWTSGVLRRPASQTVPMRLGSVLQGVALLGGALRHVEPEALTPREASGVLECAEQVRVRRSALVRAQEPLGEAERRDLARKRCVVTWCHVERHANGMCRQHYDQNRRAS